jgi:hypothetical protein
MNASPTRRRTRLPALLVAATALAAAGLLAPEPAASAATGTVARMWDCSLYTGKCVRTNSGTGTSDSCRWAGRYIVVGPTPAMIGCEAWRR